MSPEWCLCIVGTDNKTAVLAFSKGNNLHVISIFLFLSSGTYLVHSLLYCLKPFADKSVPDWLIQNSFCVESSIELVKHVKIIVLDCFVVVFIKIVQY